MALTQKTSELADTLCRAIGQVRRAFWNRAAERLERHHESIFSWQVLSLTAQQPGGKASQRELATLCAQHPTVISRALDDLEARGLVRRQRDAADRRRLVVEVTAQGKKHFEKIRPDVMSVAEASLAKLDGRERIVLEGLLRKLMS